MNAGLQSVHHLAWGALLVLAGVITYEEVAPSDVPKGVITYKDVVYRRLADRWAKLDVYVPPGTPPTQGRPTIVAIHGGSWRGGTKNGYGRQVARLTTHGYVVVSVDYVLARRGRPTWPASRDDVREAVRWVRRHAADYGVDPTRIAAIGSSAGGHLAALLGTDASKDDPDSRVEAVVDLYGPSDLVALAKRPGADVQLELYLGKTLASDAETYRAASPIHHVSNTAASFLFIHGASDDSVPVVQSTTLADRLRSEGVAAELIVVPGVGHSFGLNIEGRDLVPEILGFLDRVWARKRKSSRRA